MEEQGGVCGDTPDTSPVHKRFRQGSPSPEILVTTGNNTQTKCCEESKIDHHYDSNNRKSSESVESQVSSLSVEIAKCAEVGNDQVEITHSKVDQFNFTDDSEIFLSSTSYSSSRSKAQKHLISSANANKPRKIDVEDQCRLQELKENSKTDLGLSLRNPKPQHEMESLSEKVCSLESISNNEDLIDVANTFQTDSYPLTNDNGRDNISEMDVEPSLCLLDFCDSNHLATKQALPFRDSSVVESREKCGCPLTAQVVRLNHQTADHHSTKTGHLYNCKEAARSCEEHVWKSESPERHQHSGGCNTQIKSQPTLDSSPDHIEIKPTPDGHLCCEDSDILKNQPTIGRCAGQSDIKPTPDGHLCCEDSDILKNQPTVGSCAGESDIKPTAVDNLCCEDSDILKNQPTIGSCAGQSDIKPTAEDNLCCEDSDIVKNQSTIGSCADQSDGDVCCGDSVTRIRNQLPSDSIIDQNDDKHITEQKQSICINGQHCGLTPTQGNNAIGKDLNETTTENTDDFRDKEKGVAEEGSVVYMYSDRYLQLCDAMVRVPGRACMVHRLIESYGLLRYVRVVPPCELVREDLLQFHTEDYLAILERLNTQGEDGYDEQSQLCGIGYDCPALPGVLDYASLVAGATVTAADFLLQGKCSVAINWFGGWHHAKKDEASGFCYINDIVLGILRLREKFQRVLYIDLDLHHGDGVEDAFAFTSKVFTLSFHKYGSGFFPGTGPISEVGVGKGRYFSLNVPLLDGIRDDHFYAIVSRLTEKVREVYRPQAVVCQCGADGLAGDPMDSFNLSHLGLGKSIHSLIQWKLPLLLLGGGGYNHANTARAWAFLTGVAVGKKLPPDIPDHQFFTAYGPTYELAVTTGNRKDLNTHDHLTRVFRQALGILQKTSQVLKDFKKDVRS